MYYQIISFSHKNCDQSMREKLAFSSDEEKKVFLDQLVGFEFVYEAFVISTCNRVDVVMATRDNFSSYHAVLGLMSQKSALNFYELKTNAQRYDDEEAVEHIFSVVSSLDSLVIGESQITGQVKDAFRFSHKNGTAGRKLNRVLSYAVKCAAEVRNATNISQNPISIASVAVAQAHKLLGDNIQGMKGIVVGAGDMGVLAAKHLLRVGCDVVLIGRDLEKTQAVADSLGENVKADTIDTLAKYINQYRLLFSATSSKETVITREMIENETLPRHWFDMAIPRDIEEMDLDKLHLFRIDDLRNISNDNHALREEHAVKAAEIVEKYKDEFYAWLRALSI
jgi:glutamyl-tRNA reductase